MGSYAEFTITATIRQSLLNLMALLAHPDSMYTFARPPRGPKQTTVLMLSAQNIQPMNRVLLNGKEH